MTLIDTAPIYGFGRSEEIVGKALEGSFRHKVTIATKVGLAWKDGAVYRDSRPARIRKEIEDSLRRLRTDVIDLYQVHWPDLEATKAEIDAILKRCIVNPVSPAFMAPPVTRPKEQEAGECQFSRPAQRQMNRNDDAASEVTLEDARQQWTRVPCNNKKKSEEYVRQHSDQRAQADPYAFTTARLQRVMEKLGR